MNKFRRDEFIMFENKLYKQVDDTIEVGDIFYAFLTEKIDFMIDCDYGVYNPNTLGKKLIEVQYKQL